MTAELAAAGAAPRRTAKVLVLVGTGHFFAHFYVIVLPPLFPLLRDELAVSYAALGLLLTMPSLATMMLQTPVGFLVDRFGARWPLVNGLGTMSGGGGAAGDAHAVRAGAGDLVRDHGACGRGLGRVALA